MARNTTVDTTEERNTFLLELFRRQPDLKSSEAQERFKAKFGSAAGSRVLNQLREQAQAEAEAEAEVEAEADEQLSPEPTSEDAAQLLQSAVLASAESQGVNAPAPKSGKSAKGQRLKHVFIEAPKEQLEFLERVVVQLQEAGVTNFRIDHGTERWMVFAVESK
ncbi:MAG: hypothetical protein WBV82_28415 [Myxococcaceae bacterium]